MPSLVVLSPETSRAFAPSTPILAFVFKAPRRRTSVLDPRIAAARAAACRSWSSAERAHFPTVFDTRKERKSYVIGSRRAKIRGLLRRPPT